ncbi:MAG: valine--tRNA ligase [Candidatus Omnitrophota bacterium]|nr:MAG: valine--tRNA ligase [Candidatus Omnitrophota bacterium]
MNLDKKYNPKQVEENIYNFWIKEDYFSSHPTPNKKSFCIVIPPPNITGILHMGHALNNTIQDVLVRFKRMQGYASLWMPGTDHAGIATQNVVERSLSNRGLRKEDIGREEFLKLLWEWTHKYGSTIIEQLKKLGASCDWKRARFTMDEEYSEVVKEVFVRLYEKGLIYRGKYIINWCPRCKTALSDEEAPYKEIDGRLYYIKYPVKKSPSKITQEYVVVATTRPETMLGDTALAFNPKDTRYKWRKDAKVILPIIGRELRVIEDEAVDPDFGTGLVKVTPAHDPLDFTLAKKYNLEFVNIMNEDATLNENAKEFSGMDRFKARKNILQTLKDEGLFDKEEPHKISAGHCYRCGTLIEPRLSTQWFVRMKPLAEPAIKVVEEDKIKFYPSRWKKVYLNWMYNIQDWCISRQIWWGHRLPVYYCKRCQNNLSEDTLSDTQGIIVSKTRPPECPVCGSKDLVQDEDVLDTWFSSWLWPFAVFYWPKQTPELDYFYPTSCLVTASEILFFWVARMIMASLEFTEEIPFKDVIIHGTVRDEKGFKMSKSLGNIIDPLEIIEKFGADSLRFSLMMLASTGADVYLSDEKFLVGRNFSNKIWNASRFILTRIEEENIVIRDLEIKDNLDLVDKWLIYHLNQTVEEVTKYLGIYKINEAVKKMYEFFWHIFCDWYIEISKDNFNLHKAKMLVFCLIHFLKLIHPVMPFISEHIFQLIKSMTELDLEKSIMVANWPKKVELVLKDEELEIMDSAIRMVREIRNLKADLGIPFSEKLTVTVKVSERCKDFVSVSKKWIMRLASLKELELKDNLERVLFKNKDLEFNLSLSSFDREKFVVRLNKKISDLEMHLKSISKRLENISFIKNAPQEKVEEQREKFTDLSNHLQRLKYLKDIFV